MTRRSARSVGGVESWPGSSRRSEMPPPSRPTREGPTSRCTDLFGPYPKSARRGYLRLLGSSFNSLRRSSLARNQLSCPTRRRFKRYYFLPPQRYPRRRHSSRPPFALHARQSPPSLAPGPDRGCLFLRPFLPPSLLLITLHRPNPKHSRCPTSPSSLMIPAPARRTSMPSLL